MDYAYIHQVVNVLRDRVNLSIYPFFCF